MKKKRIYPFSLTLAGLTLKGKQREISRAYYELEGEELERKLLEIEVTDKKELHLAKLELDHKYGHLDDESYDRSIAAEELSGKELEIEQLVIDRKYSHITKEQYDYKLAELKYKDSEHSTDLPFARLELDKKYGKITEKEFDKAVYSLGDRPWVDVVSSEYNDNAGSDGFSFELDWNDAFIKLLKSEGYNGATDEAIVEQWFEDKALDTYLAVLADQMTEIGEDPDDVHRQYGRGQTLREKLEDNKSRHY